MLRTISTVVVLAASLSAEATLVLDAAEGPSGTFSLSVTTDTVFDVLEVQVNGDVANGANIVPIDGLTSTRQFVASTPTLTFLSPLGSPSTEGVFDPGINADIDLTLGITNPLPGEWTVGLTSAPTLQFDLISGLASATANLLHMGVLVETVTLSSISIAAIPEPSLVGVFAAGTALALTRRRRQLGSA